MAAAEAFESFLERSEHSAQAGRARFFLAESLVQMGDYVQGHAEFCALATELNSLPEPMRSRVRFRQGESAYFLGLHAEAEAVFSEFRRTYPDSGLNAYTLPYLADLARKRGDYGTAVALYHEAIDRFPETASIGDCRFGQAECYRQLGDLDAARGVLTDLQRTATPRIASAALYSLAMLEYSAQSCSAALEHLADFIERFPDDPRIDKAHYWLGIFYFATDQYEEAARTLLIAEELLGKSDSPMQPSCWFYLAEALRHVGKPEQARWRYARLVSQSPQHEQRRRRSRGDRSPLPTHGARTRDRCVPQVRFSAGAA